MLKLYYKFFKTISMNANHRLCFHSLDLARFSLNYFVLKKRLRSISFVKSSVIDIILIDYWMYCDQGRKIIKIDDIYWFYLRWIKANLEHERNFSFNELNPISTIS